MSCVTCSCSPYTFLPSYILFQQKKNWCSWSCNTVTCENNFLSRMFEFPVSISRDRWWGSTLLSKWHSDVLLSTSDWPPFYQPSTLADASWYVNVILEPLLKLQPQQFIHHRFIVIGRNGVFTVISPHHHAVPALLIFVRSSSLGLLPFYRCLLCCSRIIYWLRQPSTSSIAGDCLCRGGCSTIIATARAVSQLPDTHRQRAVNGSRSSKKKESSCCLPKSCNHPIRTPMQLIQLRCRLPHSSYFLQHPKETRNFIHRAGLFSS